MLVELLRQPTAYAHPLAVRLESPAVLYARVGHRTAANHTCYKPCRHHLKWPTNRVHQGPENLLIH